jgi:hypothetical protein
MQFRNARVSMSRSPRDRHTYIEWMSDSRMVFGVNKL